RDVALELAPLAGQALLVFGVALDEVAHADDELRLEQVELLDGAGKDPGAMAPGPVADDGELELGGVVVEPQVGDGVALLALEVEFGPGGAAGGPGRRDQQDDGAKDQKGTLHRG